MKKLALSGVLVMLVCGQQPLAVRAAQSCAQMNDRMFGADGRGGDAARFRALRAKIDAETRSGQAQAAAKDRAVYSRLAASIMASAKTMQGVSCKPRIVAQANPNTGQSNTGLSNGNQVNGSQTNGNQSNGSGRFTPTAPPLGSPGVTVITMRSPHGCVGFKGSWQTQTGLLKINNGAGALGITWFSGDVRGNVYSGGWANPQPGYHGTFVMTLAPDGDSIFADLKNSNGTSGSWTAACAGP
jgi:hypothetical protein